MAKTSQRVQSPQYWWRANRLDEQWVSKWPEDDRHILHCSELRGIIWFRNLRTSDPYRYGCFDCVALIQRVTTSTD